MVRNNFMMHLCTFATLCFFKITFPRNYYYCNQDDIPWVCVLKYASNSNCCHRHLELYISMSKSFHTYRKYIYQQSHLRRQSSNSRIRYLLVQLPNVYERHIFFFLKQNWKQSWPSSLYIMAVCSKVCDSIERRCYKRNQAI